MQKQKMRKKFKQCTNFSMDYCRFNRYFSQQDISQRAKNADIFEKRSVKQNERKTHCLYSARTVQPFEEKKNPKNTPRYSFRFARSLQKWSTRNAIFVCGIPNLLYLLAMCVCVSVFFSSTFVCALILCIPLDRVYFSLLFVIHNATERQYVILPAREHWYVLVCACIQRTKWEKKTHTHTKCTLLFLYQFEWWIYRFSSRCSLGLCV